MKNRSFLTLSILFSFSVAAALIFKHENKKREIGHPAGKAQNAIHEPNLTSPGGPTQPEVQSYTPIDANDLVNPFTGAFSYNIPLIDVGGFPVNISYDPDISMEEEASCVGLGWSLNIGSVNRVVRGLPDDFNGTDKLAVQETRQNEVDIGIAHGGEIEVFGKDIGTIKELSGSSTLDLWLNYNNYTGWASSLGLDLSGELTHKYCEGKLGVGLNASSSEGFSVNASLDAIGGKEDYKGGFKGGFKYASLTGSKEFSFGLKVKGKISSVKTGLSTKSSFKSYAPFYPPPSRFPSNSAASTFDLKIGAEFAFVRPHGTLSGYVRTESFDKTTHYQPAYGYFFEHLAKADENFMLDCQREQDGWVNEKYPQQPVSHQTYDWFNVSGMGISGEFRPIRHDYIMIGDGTIEESVNPDVSLGAEVAFGNLLGVGGNLSLTLASSESGIWRSDNQLANSAFAPSNAGEGSVEVPPVYFKDVSELTPLSASDEDDFKRMGEFKPMVAKVDLGKVKDKLVAGETEIDANTLKRKQEGSLKHALESPRIKTLSYLNAKDAGKWALLKKIEAYPKLNASRPPNEWNAIMSAADRTDGDAIEEPKRKKPHHLSELNVVKDDGTRYVYGIPVYNTLSKDVAFNVSRDNLDLVPGTKLVKYDPSVDNSINNTNGVDESFRTTTTPAYAHAFYSPLFI